MVKARRSHDLFTPAFPKWDGLKSWMEDNYTLPSSNAISGGQKIKLTARQDGIAEAFDDPSVEIIVMILPAQTEGKSEIMTGMALCVADTRPANQIFCFDGDERNNRLRREKLNPVLKRNKRLARRFAKKNSKTMANNKHTLEYVGGALEFITAGSEGSSRSATVRYLYLDELAVYPSDDVLDNLKSRDSSFASNSKVVMASTPGSTINCKITAEYVQTNMCQWWMPCPHNGGQPMDDWHWFVPDWDCVQVEWGVAADLIGEEWQELVDLGVIKVPDDPVALAFTFWCPVCGSEIADANRIEWTERGEWRPQQPWITDKVGFHMTGFASSLRTLIMLCKDFNKQDERGFTKNVLAKPYQEVTKDALDPEKLDIWRVDPPGPYADLRTAAVDVQGNRLVYQVVDWFLGDRGYILVQETITRRPHEEGEAEQEAGFVEYEEFVELDGALKYWAPDITFVDGGAWQSYVVKGVDTLTGFNRRGRLPETSGTLIIKGAGDKDGFDTKNPSPLWRKAQTGELDLILGSNEGKMNVRDMLEMAMVTADRRHCPADLLKELTSERLQIKTDLRRNSRPRYEWYRIRANEAWDLLNYNFIAQRYATDGVGLDHPQEPVNVRGG